MILVALGTQDLSFNRLLIKIDELIELKIIEQPVFAQIGCSTYEPQHFEFCRMMPYDAFQEKLAQCDLFITHGGTGSLVGALKLGKRVIAVPRLAKYGEHVDDHQKQIISVFEDAGMIISIEEMKDMERALADIQDFVPSTFVSNKTNMIALIEDYIQSA